MRLFSNSGSVRRGELSVLAIAETILATGISFWLAWRLSSIQHIVLVGLLAPLLLLRTPLSTSYAIRVFRKNGQWIENELSKMIDDGRFLSSDRRYAWQRLSWRDPFLLALIMFSGPFMRIFSTARVFFRQPIRSVQAIPANFVRNIAVVDFVFAPQVFPGSDELTGRRTFPHLYMMLGYIITFISEWHHKVTQRKSKIRGAMISISGIILFSVICLPWIVSAVAYRLSLKSTALLWLPLVWLVAQVRPATQLMPRLVMMTRTAWAKVMLTYSGLILLAFVAKLVLLFGVWQFANLDWLGPLGVAATQLAAPFELPLWQAAAAFNATLTITFFFRADQHLLAQGTSEAWPEVWIRREYTAFQLLQTVISLYVIACTFYIIAAVAWHTDWPPIRFVLFPWRA